MLFQISHQRIPIGTGILYHGPNFLGTIICTVGYTYNKVVAIVLLAKTKRAQFPPTLAWEHLNRSSVTQPEPQSKCAD